MEAMMTLFEQRCATATLSLLFFGMAGRNDMGLWPVALFVGVMHATRLIRLMLETDPKERG